jgi:small-conductance mechanosensitive channel
MQDAKYQSKLWTSLGAWAALAAVACVLRYMLPYPLALPGGISLYKLVAIIAGTMALSRVFALLSTWSLMRANKPVAEAMMIGRLYWVLAAFVVGLAVLYGAGKLETFGAFFAMFGGLFLGMSLGAPVSGFAAWVLVALKRPFRPGDRVQFPNLGLTGDVKDVGLMYLTLDQVGGSIGSEEAVGRHILLPNAMLFSQVAINYNAVQAEGYMLDEVVVRITFDSNWEMAEQILLNAARDLTKEIIEATKVQPYIRSDMYDYGIYMRLRYQTPAKDRAEYQYKISKRIFEEIQRTPVVDMAIPFVYSARAGARDVPTKSPLSLREPEAQQLQEIPIDRIKAAPRQVDMDVINQLAQSIAAQGLLQAIVLVKGPHEDLYDIAAGHLRLEACKRLGWKTIPAVVREIGTQTTPPPLNKVPA